MDKTLMLYHSGVGSTKMISQLISEKLTTRTEVRAISIEDIKDFSLLEDYTILCIGFPTYHASPSKTMTKFISILPYFENPKFVFAYTTCGFYSANTLRIFAKQCKEKNLIVVYSQSYLSPATDGILISPNIKIFLDFEKGLLNKIDSDIENFFLILQFCEFPHKLPKFKLCSILNYPNKLLGSVYKPKIYYFENLCCHCNNCIIQCPNNCLSFDSNKALQHFKNDCEHCYRCIHYCQKKALSLDKQHSPKKQFDLEFWKNKKTQFDLEFWKNKKNQY